MEQISPEVDDREGLLSRDLAVLEFERARIKTAGGKGPQVRERFGMTSTRLRST
jgi:hypothetical protein